MTIQSSLVSLSTMTSADSSWFSTFSLPVRLRFFHLNVFKTFTLRDHSVICVRHQSFYWHPLNLLSVNMLTMDFTKMCLLILHK